MVYAQESLTLICTHMLQSYAFHRPGKKHFQTKMYCSTVGKVETT